MKSAQKPSAFLSTRAEQGSSQTRCFLKTQIPKWAVFHTVVQPLVFLLLLLPPPLPLSWPILQGNLRIDDMSGLLSGISAEWAPGIPAAKAVGITHSAFLLLHSANHSSTRKRPLRGLTPGLRFGNSRYLLRRVFDVIECCTS